MVVANVDAYKLAATTFRGTAANGGPSVTFADYAEIAAGGFSTNARMPATDANVARGIVYRKGRTGLRTACLPQWARSRWMTSTRTRPAGNGISR